MIGSHSVRFALAAALAAGAPLGTAWAQSTLHLEGSVPTYCAISGEGFADVGGTITRTVDLSNPQSIPDIDLNFTLTCLETFSLAVIPQYARFENIDVPSGDIQAPGVGDAYLDAGSPVPGFRGGLKYTLTAALGGVVIPGGGAGPSYTSPGLGPGVAMQVYALPPQSASFTVTFDPVEIPASESLVAGAYNEQIVLQLTPEGV